MKNVSLATAFLVLVYSFHVTVGHVTHDCAHAHDANRLQAICSHHAEEGHLHCVCLHQPHEGEESHAHCHMAHGAFARGAGHSHAFNATPDHARECQTHLCNVIDQPETRYVGHETFQPKNPVFLLCSSLLI